MRQCGWEKLPEGSRGQGCLLIPHHWGGLLGPALFKRASTAEG
jgi:hypothetical protein